jgi:DNA polymerase III, gamma/tau subunits
MLDLYEKDQLVAYKTIKNATKNNKLIHAYLLELNGYSKGFDFALSFAKHILCEKSYTNKDKCENCNQCNMIDMGNFLELKVISPEGQWIKKEQLVELQNDFSKKAIVGTKKVYIINGAEKLNAFSANSILKFLEEPSTGIIAILLTENIHQVLDTIVSRCQTLSLKKEQKPINIIDTYHKLANYSFNNQIDIDNFLTEGANKDKIDILVDYINFYEKNGLKAIIYKNKPFLETFNDKKNLLLGFQWMILFYKDILNHKLETEIIYFNDYKSDIEIISSQNGIDVICEKIKIVVELSETIKFNANSNMLMDKLIIELSEV